MIDHAITRASTMFDRLGPGAESEGELEATLSARSGVVDSEPQIG